MVRELHRENAMASIPSQKKTKTILVVDDEASTRGLISMILRQGGYSVLEASDSESAASIHSCHQGEIDLLLTDLCLPGPSGGDLAASLRLSEPNLQVLFMSGMPDSGGYVPFLRKPFGVAELLRQVETSIQ
jgi:two-component system, cell cycle sensor histidine kinase and response regulator CckA